jgi:biotin carboxylase
MPRVLLLLPSATYRTHDFMTAAAAVGAEVVVATDHSLAVAPLMGARPVVVDFDRPEAAADRIVARALEEPIDAIVPVDDGSVEVAALAAARLRLPHNLPEAVATTRNKAVLREVLTRAGMPQPAWRLVASDEDVEESAQEVGWPCVLKPLSLSGSRGVIRADDRAGAGRAARRVRKIIAEGCRDPAEAMLVEAFVPGPEVAVEGLLRGGRFEVLALFDKPDPLDGPYFEETIYVTPSRHDPATAARVEARVAEACAALGLSEGPVHAEVRVWDGDEWVLEVAARSIGGLCSRSLRFGVGISLEELLLRHALGLPSEGSAREEAAAGVMMIPIRAAGVLAGVAGEEAAKAVPGIEGLEVTIPRGREVRPLPEGDRYLGFMFARAGTPEEVEGALRTAHARLEIDISPARQRGAGEPDRSEVSL